MSDTFDLDSITDIARTEGYGILLKQIEALAVHHEELVVRGAAREPFDTIRFAAGRANGMRLILSHLKEAKAKARNG